MSRLLTVTFTTAAFVRSSSRLFEASSYQAAPKGLPSSFAQHDAFASSRHTITSKPAIEDHFKTGQRTITWTNLFYLTGWRSGKSSLTQSGPSSSALRCRLSYQPDVLQDHIPVLPFLRRKVSFENQVTSSRSAGDTRYRLTNYLHQLASCIIGVECRYDFGPGR